jgi:hypothetical protein
MAKFQITGPDGQAYEVTAPDDATEDQVLEYVKRSAGTVAAPAPERPGALERGARGVMQGLRDPLDASKQMFSRFGAAIGLPGADDAVKYWDADIRERNDAYRRDVRGGQSDLDFGRMAGNMLATAPISAAMPVGGTLAQAAGASAVGSAAAAGLQPVTQGDFLTEKLKQVGTGAAAGALSGAAANMLGRVIQPRVSDEVRMIRGEGVTPTPGQILGGRFKATEERLSSVPIVGSAIKTGQQRAAEEFNEAAVNRALAPVGKALPKGTTGREAIEFATTELGKAYDDALNAVGPIGLDRQLSTDLRRVYSELAVLPKDKAEQFARIVQTEIGNRAQAGRLTPEAMKAAESNLGTLARGYMRAQDFDQQQLGEAIFGAQKALRDAVERQAPAGAADAVRAANAGWANFKRVQRAASYTGAEDGVFSAAQLQSAVRALDPSKDKARFARGNALMQDLSEAGKKVLGNKVPNSGTPERLMTAGLAGGALVGGATLNPAIAAGALPALMYTPAGQRMMAGLLAGRQGPAMGLLSDATQRLAVPGGLALTPALQGLIDQ